MGNDWFSVYVESCALAAEQDVTPPDEAVAAWLDLLAVHSGVVSAGPGGWGATISVQAANAADAAAAGSELIARLARQAGLPGWPVVQIDVVRDDALKARRWRPALPEARSAPAAAEPQAAGAGQTTGNSG